MTLKKCTADAVDISSEIYDGIMEEMFSSAPEVINVISQMLEVQGKAARPAFMTHVASLAGVTWYSVHKAAMIIEAIHLASLLHDDVLDGSSLRRGVETLNVRYSDKVSVLSGDYIFIKAIEMAHALDNPEVLPVILRAVDRMVQGEIKDSLMRGIIDEDTYLSIVADKTAALFSASGELAVMLSGASESEIRWGRELGECVGTAFQIVDDTLDYQENTDVLGKPGLMDAGAGRMTLPLIYSLRKYDASEIEVMLGNGNGSVDKLSALVSRNGGIEYAMKRARDYLDSARDISRRFDNRKAQDDLSEFFDVLVGRRS